MADNLQALIEQRGSKPVLLVVDDQVANIRALYEIFRHECEVYMATNGEQALALAFAHQPDLVLLDIMMPDMDGYAVCDVLKQDDRTQDMPVIFLTANRAVEDEVQCFQHGAVDFISKPVNSFVVKARVNNHLELKLQKDYLRSMAMTDGLTGIYNRRYFDEELARDWLIGARESQPLTLLLIDIDYFKNYNDNYGHAAGDACLQLIARVIKEQCRRPGDRVARYGGEEFVCILPRTDYQGALHIAENIRRAVESQNPLPSSSGTVPPLTVSLGMACCLPKADIAAEALVKRADQCLYEAKRSGRNRVVARDGWMAHQASVDLSAE